MLDGTPEGHGQPGQIMPAVLNGPRGSDSAADDSFPISSAQRESKLLVPGSSMPPLVSTFEAQNLF